MTRFAGRHILIIEDEVIVGMDLQMQLEDLGCEVVGPVTSVDAALEVIRNNHCDIDAAVLDINLHGAMSFEVADALSKTGVPFVMVTGYNLRNLPIEHRERPVLRKPYSPIELLTILEGAVSKELTSPGSASAASY